MTVEEKIEKGLIAYLKAEHGLDAVTASLYETEYTPSYGGCDTCGYGEDPANMSFQINFRTEEERKNAWSRYVTVQGDPLSFFPVLYGYMVEDSE